MRGCEYDKAEEEQRNQRFMTDAIIFRFRRGNPIGHIAQVYEMSPAHVEAILRDHLNDMADIAEGHPR